VDDFLFFSLWVFYGLLISDIVIWVFYKRGIVTGEMNEVGIQTGLQDQGEDAV